MSIFKNIWTLLHNNVRKNVVAWYKSSLTFKCKKEKKEKLINYSLRMS